jgi:GTP:adenosylcobinamide-phosphate guanylyltransferase
MLPVNSQYTVIIMAGSRGSADPVAKASHKSHKCLVEVAGQPMLLRVLETLESSPHVRQIVLCIEQSFSRIDWLDKRIASGALIRLDADRSPATSALRACEKFADAFPLLIVTADHPLLDTEMLSHFCVNAASGGDVVVGVARAELVLSTYRQSNRTLLRFADGARCGCNLFALNNLQARAAIDFWTTLEAERKRPWRLIRMLSIGALLRYVTGRLSLSDALQTLSQKLAINAQSVEMPFAEAAIDVDNLSDLALVESILRNRLSK